MKTILKLLLLINGLAGCASTISNSTSVNYPDNWPQLERVTAGSCVNLSGTFSYLGEKAVSDQLSTPKLDAIVFGKVPSVRGDVVNVRFSHDQVRQELSIKFEGNELSPVERTAYKVDVECENGSNIISIKKDGKSEGTRVRSIVRNRLMKSVDGSLIVHLSFKATSVDLGIISRSRSGENWYKFLPSASVK